MLANVQPPKNRRGRTKAKPGTDIAAAQETWFVFTPTDMESLLSASKEENRPRRTSKNPTELPRTKFLCVFDPHPMFDGPRSPGWVQHTAKPDDARALLEDSRLSGCVFLDRKKASTRRGTIPLVVHEWVRFLISSILLRRMNYHPAVYRLLLPEAGRAPSGHIHIMGAL
jgi:hypothetical protein